MSSEPKSPSTSANAESSTSQNTALAGETASTRRGRPAYAAPRVTRLGSVRDLTLGSPVTGPGDLAFGMRRVM